MRFSSHFRLSPLVLALQLSFTPAALMLGSSLAQAESSQAEQINYDIPAGALAPALTRFAQQAGISVAVDAQALKGLNTRGLKGSYHLNEGFGLLLAGTGYAAEKTSAGYALRKAASVHDEHTQQNGAALPEVTVKASAERESRATSEGTGSYAARAVTVGKGEQSLRDTPQSVTVMTRQRMDDQNLTTIDNVLMQATGVTRQFRNYGHSLYYSRGFALTNFMLDGVPMGDYGGIGTAPDTAMLDRVEVLRGAPGLLVGNGDPGGVVNMVRKRPQAEKQIQLTVRAGSWDYYRTDVDITGALNDSGSVRGRTVVAYEDRQYFYDEASSKLPLFYGMLEADLGANTTAAIGMRYQYLKQQGGRWRGGLPVSTDGSDLGLPRSTSLGPSWTSYSSETTEIFGDVTHHFNDQWKIKFSALHQSNDREDHIMRTAGYVNPQTMTGLQLTRAEFSKVKFETNAVDAQVHGKFDAWGQQHEVFFGANWQENETPSNRNSNVAYSPARGINLNNYDLSSLPRLYAGTYGAPYSSREIRQGVYGNLKLQVVDALKVILGGRVSWYEYEDSTNVSRKQTHEVTPFAAAMLRLNEQWSLYGSYTDIFSPQSSSFTSSGRPLDPAIGTNVEAGIKGEFYGGKLNTSLAVFRIKQDNMALTDPAFITGCPGSPTGGGCFINAGKVKSQGFEAEINGELSPGWQVSAGYTFNDAEYLRASGSNAAGDRLSSDHNPRQLLRSWTSYRLPGSWENLTVGGGFTLQSETSYIDAGVERKQSGYSVWNAYASYKLDKQWTAALNVNNLFDRHYYTSPGASMYGEPQSLMLTLRGIF